MKNNRKNSKKNALELNKKSVSKFNVQEVTGGVANTQNTCRRSVCVTCHTIDWSK
ncbi:hypothetical protein [Kordia sp.]|uniref:hypothetical protein n=1 Tax=Kordia sp. TaxID=1965332 RepID=UPI0025B92AF0|nr:hypothetical protein [Kordia sp.]MCH2195482.1 hypothetical protein [Kordia sp.]